MEEQLIGFIDEQIPVYKGSRRGLYYYQDGVKKYVKGSIRNHITFIDGYVYDVTIAKKKHLRKSKANIMKYVGEGTTDSSESDS